MHRLLFLELQSKPALRTFATDTSLLRTLVRTTDTCFLPNQQIRIERLTSDYIHSRNTKGSATTALHIT